MKHDQQNHVSNITSNKILGKRHFSNVEDDKYEEEKYESHYPKDFESNIGLDLDWKLEEQCHANKIDRGHANKKIFKNQGESSNYANNQDS